MVSSPSPRTTKSTFGSSRRIWSQQNVAWTLPTTVRTSGFQRFAVSQMTRASGSVAVIAVVPTMSGRNSSMTRAMSSCDAKRLIAS
jgi:hypothetical protein